MYNSYFAHNEEELTAYDRFLMTKNNWSSLLRNMKITLDEPYDEYLLKTLQRKNHGEKVMTREEFYSVAGSTKEAKAIAKENVKQATYGSAQVPITKSKERAGKLGGKLAFACYGLIVLGLALAIIIKSTGGFSVSTMSRAKTDASQNGEPPAISTPIDDAGSLDEIIPMD